MKVAVTYEGWVEDGKNNSRLYNKNVVLERICPKAPYNP